MVVYLQSEKNYNHSNSCYISKTNSSGYRLCY